MTTGTFYFLLQKRNWVFLFFCSIHVQWHNLLSFKRGFYHETIKCMLPFKSCNTLKRGRVSLPTYGDTSDHKTLRGSTRCFAGQKLVIALTPLHDYFLRFSQHNFSAFIGEAMTHIIVISLALVKI